MKLTPKSIEVLECIKDSNGKLSIDELVEVLGRTARSISANITDLTKKDLVTRILVKSDSAEEKDVTYAVLTEKGMAFDPSQDEDEE